MPDTGLEHRDMHTQQVADVTTKRIPIKTATLERMLRLQSLFSDEIAQDAKEAEVIAYFIEKSFETFLKSGIVEDKLKDLLG